MPGESLIAPVTPAAPAAAAPAAPAAAAPAAPAAPAAAAPGVAERPAFLPESFWDKEKGAIKLNEFGVHYQEVAQFHQAETQRRAGIPAKPEDYALELPKDFKVPDGFKPEQFKVNDKDPRLPMARAIAKELGLDQAGFSKLIALDANMQAQAITADRAAATAELAKLGEKAPARIGAIETYLKANLVESEYEAIRPAFSSAAAVVAMEKIIAKATGQAVPTGGSPAPIAPPADPNSIPGYATMTFEQRRNAQYELANKAA